MPLYGNELDRETSPLQAGLGRFVQLDREPGFVGRDALRREAEVGPARRARGPRRARRGHRSTRPPGVPTGRGRAHRRSSPAAASRRRSGMRSRWPMFRPTRRPRVPCSRSASATRASRPSSWTCRSTDGHADELASTDAAARVGGGRRTHVRPGSARRTTTEMDVPADLRYTEDHEWVRLDDGEGAVGITAYAADELGDVVFVELPKPGRRVARREVFGVIESVKTASDLYAPGGGRGRGGQRGPCRSARARELGPVWRGLDDPPPRGRRRGDGRPARRGRLPSRDRVLGSRSGGLRSAYPRRASADGRRARASTRSRRSSTTSRPRCTRRASTCQRPSPSSRSPVSIADLAGRNRVGLASFLGAGMYAHHIPASVDAVSRAASS